MLDDYVTTQKAVEILKQSGVKRGQRYIADLCARGKFKQCKLLGKTWVIHKDEIEAYKIQCLPQAMRKNKSKRVRNADNFGGEPELEKKTA